MCFPQLACIINGRGCVSRDGGGTALSTSLKIPIFTSSRRVSRAARKFAAASRNVQPSVTKGRRVYSISVRYFSGDAPSASRKRDRNFPYGKRARNFREIIREIRVPSWILDRDISTSLYLWKFRFILLSHEKPRESFEFSRRNFKVRPQSCAMFHL